MLHGKPRLLPAGDAAVKTIGLHVAGEALQQIGSVGGTVARMAEEDDGLVRGVGVLQRVFGREPGTNSWVYSSVSRMSTSLASPLEKRSKASCGDMAGSMGTPLPRLHKAAGLGWGVFPVAQYAVKAYGTREAGARRIRCAGLADNRPVGLEKG